MSVQINTKSIIWSNTSNKAKSENATKHEDMVKFPEIKTKAQNVTQNRLRLFQDHEFFKDDIIFDSWDEDDQNIFVCMNTKKNHYNKSETPKEKKSKLRFIRKHVDLRNSSSQILKNMKKMNRKNDQEVDNQ